MTAAHLPLRKDAALGVCHVQYLRLSGEPLREYFVFVPPESEASPPLVLVHGISRNAAEMVMRFSADAERHKVPLIAPLFRKESYGMYQQLLDRRSGVRADEALFDILADVEARCGVAGQRFHLFGFSGGGQFAHRLAFLHPHRLLSCIPTSAGWYTWPDDQLKWPLGLAQPPAAEMDWRMLRQLPMHVLVGDRDTRSDETLRRSAGIDAVQGVSRVERAERFSTAMREWRVNPNCTLTVLPDVGHSFDSAFQAGVVEHVFELLARDDDLMGGPDEVCISDDVCVDASGITGTGQGRGFVRRRRIDD